MIWGVEALLVPQAETFEDLSEEIMSAIKSKKLVKKGDKFAGRYEAKSVTDQALTIVATDSGEEIIIPLLENQPLVAAGR